LGKKPGLTPSREASKVGRLIELHLTAQVTTFKELAKKQIQNRQSTTVN
jgi:hypothetical protein